MNDLKSSLALQRARRTSLTVSTLPRRSRKGLAGVGIVFGLALLGLWALGNNPGPATHSLAQAAIVFPSATFQPVAPLATAPPSRIPITRVVCASAGWVHVRFAPGANQPVRGYLSEGETVVLDDDPGNSAWVHLSSPIVGWVDVHYLCDAGERP